jgi:tRNA-dihydrouridine synthase 3
MEMIPLLLRTAVLLMLIVHSIALSPSTMSSQLQTSLKNKMILAPLTKGGNLPFRRLCTDFGMDTSVSEMIYARGLLKGSPVENARLRRAENERVFGVQFATNQIEEGLNAIELIQKSGASFVDLNCGCPIYDVTRRGLGSSLLRSPSKLKKLVKGLVDGTNLPITVKIRLGCEADTMNCLENVKAAREAGAAAITIHGRTAQQGYSKDANWELIRQAVVESREEGYGHVPIVGNGDILTYYEARRRMKETGVDSIMVGRGALAKPWIFKEFNDNATWLPTTNERIEVYYTLARYMKDHFGDDDMGRNRAWTFLPWHFQFLTRYCPYPEEEYAIQSTKKPLIQSRVICTSDDPLEILLANKSPEAHDHIAALLWESDSNSAAIQKLQTFAESPEFKQIVLTGGAIAEEDKVLANKPPGREGKWNKRQVRKPGPKRSEEEIAALREQRAKKKDMILAAGGEWPPN